MQHSAFSTLHPAVTFGFFVGAIVLCAMAQRPLFQLIGLVAACALYISLKGRRGWKLIGGMCIVIAVLALVNPLFNPQGETVLFTYFGGRAYTLQGVIYGISTALMFASILMLFASYSVVMTSDKFTYLFGGLAPAFTLVLTMVLRLVPNYIAKAGKISNARKCIGRSPADGSLKSRVGASASVLSALTTWSLEGGVITADSMRSRGYGAGKRTSYARYRFTARDAAAAVVLAAAFAVSMAYLISGSGFVQYLPSVNISPLGAFGWAGFAAFAVFMFAPFAMNVKEAAIWRFSLSKI